MATHIKKKYRYLLALLGCIIAIQIVALMVIASRNGSFDLLTPAGTIAEQQKDLMVFATVLSLVVIIPVFSLLIFILWRFRDGNVKARYRPNWDGSKKLETIWWGIPIVIILVLSVVTYKTTHSLDPYRPLESDVKPITIQVVALEWKWLFIYPEQNIATVNYVQFPEDTPINFEITSDAPMNSFWIPKLGGQVYAMSGMTTKLHLMADDPGEFEGSSANLSGEGFAGMRFKAVSTTKEDFTTWVKSTWETPEKLTISEYQQLAKPSKNVPAGSYSGRDETLFDWVINKYHDPGTPSDTTDMMHDETNNTGGH